MGVYSLTKSTIKNWVKYPNMMAGSAYLSPASDDLITETLISSSTASVTFDVSTLAASGYKHLQVRSAARNTAASNSRDIYFRFNADSGTNYSWHQLYGDGTSVTSNAGTTQTFVLGGLSAGTLNTTGIYAVSIVDIIDAFATTKNKTTRALHGNYGTNYKYAFLNSGNWRNTAAITSITITSEAGNDFASGSRFSLYASKG